MVYALDAGSMEVMYCHECGSEVDQEDEFCRSCGADLSEKKEGTRSTTESSDYFEEDKTSSEDSDESRSEGTEQESEDEESIPTSVDHSDVPSNLKSYISEGERVINSFSVRNTHSGTDDPNPLLTLIDTGKDAVLTDRRLVIEQTKGVKEIGTSHISSIQSEEANEQAAAGATFGCCGGFMLLGGLGSLDQPDTALFAILIGIVFVALAALVFRGGKIYRIDIITGDEVPESDFVLFTNEDLGPELSKAIR